MTTVVDLVMDTVTKVLVNFGLNENEVLIYKESLKTAETNPFALARATNIPRTTIYEIITSLSLKGLVELNRSDGFTKQQTKIKAVNPSEIRKIIEKRRLSLVKLENDVVRILPELKNTFHSKDPNANCQFYNGIEGAFLVYTMEEVGEVLNFNYKIPDDAFGREVINDDLSRRYKNNKNLVKEIIPLNNWTRHVFSYQMARDERFLSFREYRYIDNPLFDLKIKLSIVGSQLRIVSVENDESWGMVVESVSLSNSLRSIFWLLWLGSLSLTKEMVGSWGKNEFYEAERKK